MVGLCFGANPMKLWALVVKATQVGVNSIMAWDVFLWYRLGLLADLNMSLTVDHLHPFTDSIYPNNNVLIH